MDAVLNPLAFDEAIHAYRLDGRPVPSVTQVLRHGRYIVLFEDLFDKAERQELTWVEALSHMQKRWHILEMARRRGQDVHALAHFMVEDDLDEESIDPVYLGYVQSARAYLAANVVKVHRAEFRVFSRRRQYAGTVDLLALHVDGYLSVDDYKTGDPADVSADIQLAGYLNAILEMATEDQDLARIIIGAPKSIKRRSLRLFKDGRPAEESLYTDHYGDITRFTNALNVLHDHQRTPVPVFEWADAR